MYAHALALCPAGMQTSSVRKCMQLGSQYDTRLYAYIALHQACSKNLQFFMTRHENTTQRDARIGSESILVLQ